jgi:hypothetical protein
MEAAPLRHAVLVVLGDAELELRALVIHLVLPRLQVRLWCEEIGLLPRLYLREVEVVPPVAEALAGSVVRACRLLGTVVGPDPDARAAGFELHRLGAVQASADAMEPRRPNWVVAMARRHGVNGGTASNTVVAQPRTVYMQRREGEGVVRF